MDQSYIKDLDDSNISDLIRDIQQITTDEVYSEMNQLKSKVLGLLKDYSESINLKDKSIYKRIKTDSNAISGRYNNLLDRLNASVDCSIISMDSVAPLHKQENEMNKMFNLVEDFLEQFQGKKAKHNLYSSFVSDILERSGVSRADISVIDVNSQLYVIKRELTCQLTDKRFSQKMILETIDELDEVMNCDEADKIEEIIRKIEKKLQECQETQRDMKELLNKALYQCKEKRSEINDRSLREINDLKKQFFDLALQIKSELPKDHEGRKVLVSRLFEEGQNLQVKEWEGWLRQKLK